VQERRLQGEVRLALALSALVLAGCGSRSALLEPGASASGGAGGGSFGGAGAGGTGTGGGLTGGVGGGGFGGAGAGGVSTGGSAGSEPCPVLHLLEGPTAVQSSAKEHDLFPELVASSDDGEQVSVAFVRENVEGPAVFRKLAHATLEPWKKWPNGPQIAPSHETFAGPELSSKFRAGAGYGDHLALLVAHAKGASATTSFAPTVAASAPSAGPTMTSMGDTPAFVARGSSDRHLVGTRGGTMLYAQSVKLAGGAFVAQMSVIGCADTAPVADAVGFGDDWLVALGNGTNVVPGTSCAQAPGKPERLDLVRVSPGVDMEHVASVELGAPLLHVAVAPHPAGAYVVYRAATEGSPIRWVRVEAASGAVVGPFDVSTPLDYPLEFDASAFGQRLVVVWGNDPAGNPPDLVVSLFEPTGAPEAMYAFEPPFWGSRLSVLGAPSGKSAVVAWSGPSQFSGSPNRVSLARFDCAVEL
jgi:hypothetical protein